MPSDASIYGQIQQPQPVNQLAQLGQVMQLQGAMNQNQLAQYTMRKAMREDSDAEALNSAMRDAFNPATGAVDRNKLFANLAAQGHGAKLPGLQESFAKADKATAEVDKTKAETGKIGGEAVANRAKLYRDQWATVQDPQTAAQLLQNMHNDPAFAGTPIQAVPLEAKLATLQQVSANPAQFDQFRQAMSLGAEKFAEIFTQRRGQDMTAETARRGQDMTDRRANAQMAQTERHFQANQSAPQYMETDAGLVALPKKLPPGQQPVATPVMGPNGQALGKPLKDIPASVNSAIIQNTQSMNQVDRALSLLDGKDVGVQKGDANATGVKAYLPQAVLNRVDPQGVDARAEISDIGSLKIHDRSGAAVTVSESPRLMPFIPLATDDAATVKKKLTRLKTEIANEASALQATYSKEQGYKPSPVKPAGTGLPDAAAIDAELKRRGGK